MSKEKKFGKNEIMDTITQQVIEMLESHNSLWCKEWKPLGVPMNATNIPYQGINFLLLSFKQQVNNYSSSNWFTFNMVRKLKGSIKAGEKGTMIVFYSPVKINDKETGEEKTIPFLKYSRVWNLDQIEEMDKTKYIKELKPIDETKRNKEVEKLIKEYGKECKISHIKQDRACYIPARDTITMPTQEQFTNLHAYYSTILHEISHSTGHETRCNRDLKNSFGNEDYAFEEIIAELNSMYLLSRFNINNEAVRNNNVSYIKTWLKKLKEDRTFIFTASKLSKQAFDFLDENFISKETKEQKKDKAYKELDAA